MTCIMETSGLLNHISPYHIIFWCQKKTRLWLRIWKFYLVAKTYLKNLFHSPLICNEQNYPRLRLHIFSKPTWSHFLNTEECKRQDYRNMLIPTLCLQVSIQLILLIEYKLQIKINFGFVYFSKLSNSWFWKALNFWTFPKTQTVNHKQKLKF